MSQITSGLRAVLSHPIVYNSFQSLLGANRGCELFVEDDLRIESGQTVLDIGCGTAEILNHLPEDIEYYGFDISEDYIVSAQKNFGCRNATFHHGLFDEKTLANLPGIDVAYTSGVLHHINDDEAKQLFGLVAKALNKDGRFISADPCFIEGQNFISKFFIERDRGQNIRTPDELRKLAETCFANVIARHRNDYLRIPYDHAVLECQVAI